MSCSKIEQTWKKYECVLIITLNVCYYVKFGLTGGSSRIEVATRGMVDGRSMRDRSKNHRLPYESLSFGALASRRSLNCSWNQSHTTHPTQNKTRGGDSISEVKTTKLVVFWCSKLVNWKSSNDVASKLVDIKLTKFENVGAAIWWSTWKF